MFLNSLNLISFFNPGNNTKCKGLGNSPAPFFLLSPRYGQRVGGVIKASCRRDVTSNRESGGNGKLCGAACRSPSWHFVSHPQQNPFPPPSCRFRPHPLRKSPLFPNTLVFSLQYIRLQSYMEEKCIATSQGFFSPPGMNLDKAAIFSYLLNAVEECPFICCSERGQKPSSASCQATDKNPACALLGKHGWVWENLASIVWKMAQHQPHRPRMDSFKNTAMLQLNVL